jgi:hypothetical protein
MNVTKYYYDEDKDNKAKEELITTILLYLFESSIILMGVIKYLIYFKT